MLYYDKFCSRSATNRDGHSKAVSKTAEIGRNDRGTARQTATKEEESALALTFPPASACVLIVPKLVPGGSDDS